MASERPNHSWITPPPPFFFPLRREVKEGTMLQIEAINSTAYYSRHALTEGREARVLGLSIYGEEPGRGGGGSRCSRRREE